MIDIDELEKIAKSAMAGGVYDMPVTTPSGQVLTLIDEVRRLRALLRRAGDVVALACSGGDWGKTLAWVVNGAPSNADGVAAAKKIVSMQMRADTIAREIEEALK